MSAAPDFWEQPAQAQTVLKEKSTIEETVGNVDRATSQLGDCQALLELIAEEDTEESRREAAEYLDELNRLARSMEMQAMLGGPNDSGDAILSLNAGAGGTEAQDWAEMLFRMYLRFCEKRGWKVQIFDQQSGDEAGIKSATFSVSGGFAYGMLRAEVGVHRLVRISPYDSNARRHTSFASVFVYPDIEDEIEVDIDEKDIRVDTYRAGGKGGQKVNKTDSAVRLTHEPSGIVVQCQNERSQHQNKATAMKILKARLYEKELENKRAEQQQVEDSKMDIAWGSQIRSYVLHPYQMVKDHRTNFESSDVDGVLDGDLQEFVESFLMSRGNA